jgi:hypothetical protein
MKKKKREKRKAKREQDIYKCANHMGGKIQIEAADRKQIDYGYQIRSYL